MVDKKKLGEGLDRELQSDISYLKNQIEQQIANVDDGNVKKDLQGLLVELHAVKDRKEFESFVAKLDKMKILEKEQVSQNLRGDFAKLNKSIQNGTREISDLSQEELQAMADQGRQVSANRVAENDISGAQGMFGKGWISDILKKASS